MKLIQTSLCTAAAIVLLPQVLGHGYVQQLRIDGTSYVQTWNPYKDPQQKVTRITRQFLNNGPIPDGEFTTPVITCNVPSAAQTVNTPSNLTTPIPAGSKVEFLWTEWTSDHPGPIMTYLARCPAKCVDFKADSGNIWVKIDQAGYDASLDPPWASKRLPTINSTWPITIPKKLQSGEYILRHEILGLQRATEAGRAQFYPACHQITVTNGGSVALPAGIAIPGPAYSETDPGILLEYRNISATNPYTPPGGAVWTAAS